MTIDRQCIKEFLDGMISAGMTGAVSLLRAHVHANAVFHAAHPINRLEGRDAILEGLYAHLAGAFPHLRRRDEIFMGGMSRTGSGMWVAAMGHYVGNMRGTLFGLEPHGHLAFLRYGEFYRIEEGLIVEARILIDFLDLIRQLGRMPLPKELGTEMLFPSPATHDGVMLDTREPAPRRAFGNARRDYARRSRSLRSCDL